MSNFKTTLIETYEGYDIYEIEYRSASYEMIKVYNLGSEGINRISKELKMGYYDTVILATQHGCTTIRKTSDGKVYSPHIDFSTLEGAKNLIDLAISSRLMANLNGEYTQKELDNMIDKFKKGKV